jgi:uncharacterized membrane protein YcaP (DUF421 family)
MFFQSWAGMLATAVTGVSAYAALVALQFAVAWTSVRWPAFEHVVKNEPSQLVFRGELRPMELRRQRVSEEEVGAAMRSAGLRVCVTWAPWCSRLTEPSA